MAIGLVQAKWGSVSAALTLPVTITTPVAGNLLICSVAVGETTQPTFDTPAGWTAVTLSVPRGALFWRAADGSEGTTVTINIQGATARRYAAQVCEVSGMNTTAPFDKSGNANWTTILGTTGLDLVCAGPTTQADEFAVFSIGTTSTVSGHVIGDGYTMGSAASRAAHGYKILSAVATESPLLTWGATSNSGMYVIATFKAAAAPASTVQQNHFRIRADDTVALNTDSGWAAALDTNATIDAEKIFRIRFEVESAVTEAAKTFKLQYRRNGGTWTDVPVNSAVPPTISDATEVVASAQYVNDAATTNLLAGSSKTFEAGVGLEDNLTPSITLTNEHTEYEWALRIRLSYGQGASYHARNADGDTFEYRVYDVALGVLATNVTPTVTLNVPDYLIGGTFAETPNRAGPICDANGNLYVILEYADTSSWPMILKSADGGKSWLPQNTANAPTNDDLESVDIEQVGSTLHILQYANYEIYYDTFRTSDNASPDTWGVQNQLIHNPTVDPGNQYGSIAVRSDGSVVAVYRTDPSATFQRLGLRVRSTGGTWGSEQIIDSTASVSFSAAEVVRGEADLVYVFYVDLTNGALYYKTLSTGDVLSARTQIATGLSTSGSREHAAIKPVYYDDDGAETVVVMYSKSTDILWAKPIVNGTPGTELQVSGVAVLGNANSTSGPIAASALSGKTVYAAYSDASTSDIWYDENADAAGWATDVEILNNTTCRTISANVYTHSAGNGGAKVLGYFYDTSSGGYTGELFYGEYVLPVSAVSKSASDSATAADVVTGTVKATTDAATAADTVSNLGKPGTDTAVGADASALTAAIPVTDAATGADTAPSLGKTVADSAVGADTSALTTALAVTDTATGADASVLTVPVTAADSAVGADVSTLTAALTGTDAAVGADASVLTAAYPATDTATVADVSALTVALVASDVASGVDAVLSLARPVTDSGTASDVVTTLDAGASNTVSDTGTASDVAVLTAAEFLVSDTATGVDTISGRGVATPDAGVGADTAVVTIGANTADITSPLPPLTQAVAAATGPNTAAIANLLPALTQATAATMGPSAAAIAATLPSLTQAAAATTGPNSAAVTSPLPSLTQAAAATMGPSTAAIANLLPSLIQAAAVVSGLTITKVSGNVGVSSEKTSDTSLGLTLGAGVSVPVGHFLMLAAVVDNHTDTSPGGNSTYLSVTDTKANTWNRLIEQATNSSAALEGIIAGLYLCKVTTVLTTGDIITITVPAASTAKAMGLVEYDVGVGNDMVPVATAGAVANGATSYSVPITGLPSGDYLFIGFSAVEGEVDAAVDLDSAYAEIGLGSIGSGP